LRHKNIKINHADWGIVRQTKKLFIMKKVKTLALLLILSCAPLSVSAQRVINLNDPKANISLQRMPRGLELPQESSYEELMQRQRNGELVFDEEWRRSSPRMRIGNEELRELYPGQIKNYRPFALNPALKNPKTVSVGDTVILELFEDITFKGVVREVGAVAATGKFGVSIELPHFPSASVSISTNLEGSPFVQIRTYGLCFQFFETRTSAGGQDYLIEIDRTKAPPLQPHAPSPIYDKGPELSVVHLDENGNEISAEEAEQKKSPHR